jgi:hypothetical protein
VPVRFGSSNRNVRNEKGISLIEIMIALSILATVLVALGGLMFQMARHTRLSAAVTYRAAATASAVSWIEELPWDSLTSNIGCVADTVGSYPYNRCMDFYTVSPGVVSVGIGINSAGPLPVGPDTLVVYRFKPRHASPMNDE